MTEAKEKADNPIAPHHRAVAGGPARAAIFGVSDGLVTNVAMVLGVAGASTAQNLVRLAGLTGLVAGAFSMAAGEWISMQAQKELLERELQQERIELERRPELERRELAALYVQRGIDANLADQLATDIMSKPETALQVHAREELGVNPDALGSPWGAAISSFATFSLGALMPLLPWFWIGGEAAVVWSIVLAVIASLCVGFLLGHFTDRNRSWSALRQLLISGATAAVTFGIGSAVGVHGV